MRAREEDMSSTESSSSSSSSSSSPSSSASVSSFDGVDGEGSLVGPIIEELNGSELMSPKPKPSLGVSV